MRIRMPDSDFFVHLFKSLSFLTKIVNPRLKEKRLVVFVIYNDESYFIPRV